MEITQVRFLNSVRVAGKEITFAVPATHSITWDKATGIVQVVEIAKPKSVTYVPLANITFIVQEDIVKGDKRISK